MTRDDRDAPPAPAAGARPSSAVVPEAKSTRPEVVRAPVPTLPKGGGAIRGIGEKFTASAATGTGSLRIPLPLSPARGGFQPDLALAYDSGAGNGPFGAGFRLSVPQVSRKTDKGLPRYDDAAGTDVYVLSDAEDLVPTSGAPELDAGELVTRYRPRVEGLFARIERRTKANGEVYWRATTRDNVVSTYGASASARIADPTAARRVFTWLLEETRDDRGNVVRYEYQAEDNSNVERTSPAERNRLNGNAPFTNRYLKRVRYGNKVVAPEQPNDFAFEVVLDYGEHDGDAPGVDAALGVMWPRRQDPFSTYRATFEVRTYRLCRRVLMFHRMAAELGTEPCLVASLDLTYDENPVLTKLIKAERAGYVRDLVTGAYARKAYPPVELGYAVPQIHTNVQSLDAASLRELPGGLDWQRSQWVDLDGEGLPGILSEQDGALFYKKNMGQGVFAPPRQLLLRPSSAAMGGAVDLADVDGDGRKELVEYRRPAAGYHERADSDGWAPFLPFPSQPAIDVRDPNVRFIDLSGDGHDDILMATETGWTWFPSLAKGGFGPPVSLKRPLDDEKGPTLVFADGTQAVFLADMSGDGLVDLVRVTHATVWYWPNLGYGRFGAKVTMAVPGWLDRPEDYAPRRVRFGDVDGSGTTDVIYLHADGVRIYANQSGNRLAPREVLPKLPIDTMASVTVTDLLGTGTACVVWSSSLPTLAGKGIRYIDLMGGKKPHVLISVKNNMGLDTRLEYTSSTAFYLADKAVGRPWVTRLPFPVQVVTTVETYDAVSRVRLVSKYKYHHGYFDGVEREFRGFGLVEQEDTESFSSFQGMGLFPDMPPAENGELPQDPVLTKTWFHTGALADGGKISKQFVDEYYAGDPVAGLLPDTILPAGLSPRERREACRALKGQVLRQEVYALDGDPVLGPRPFTVSERSYVVQLLQPAGPKPHEHAVVYVHPREQVHYQYERTEADPRVNHAFTLEVDDFGNVRKSAAIAYPRRTVPQDHPEQGKLWATYTENDVANVHDDPDGNRLGIPLETRTYEVTGLLQGSEELLSFASVWDAIVEAAPPPPRLDYEEEPTTGVELRLIEHVKTRYYDSDNLPQPLAFGTTDLRALPYESYAMAFTPGLVAHPDVYGDKVTDALLQEGGHVHLDPNDDDWWIPTGRQVFDATAFFLPVEFVDPFGKSTTLTYDTYKLLVTEVEDAVGNVVAVTNDYRTMSPSLITEPNGNRSGVLYDELGMVIATAVMGKVGENDGDELDPGDLGKATTQLEYDLLRWMSDGKPNVVHVAARVTHGDPNTDWQHSYTYSDGSGREVMKKVQAEPGDAPQRDQNGELIYDENDNLVLAPADPRWVGTGRTVFNNKGNPVKQYEPFFSATFEYEDDEDLVKWGVTPILTYDALGRLVRTDLPNGSYSRVVFDPWSQTSYDPNDTVLESGNIWYAKRQPSAVPPPTEQEQDAAEAAAEHADTPTVTHFDALGRPYLVVADNGDGELHKTRTVLDIEGNARKIVDAHGRETLIQSFDMLGTVVRTESVDAGERWSLFDALASPIRRWDSAGVDHVVRTLYDDLRRPTKVFVKKGADDEYLAERTIWGEMLGASAPDKNHRGRVYQQYDGAGRVTHVEYDFKGNLVETRRELATAYEELPTWTAIWDEDDLAEIETAVDGLLEDEELTSKTEYDALNRPTKLTTPDLTETVPEYNEAGLLEKVTAKLRGAAQATPFVDDIAYNAKGQRELIAYANGVTTEYTYDPLTFRLKKILTTRAAGPNNDPPAATLQDLRYTYDPVGNVLQVEDHAQQSVFFDDNFVEPHAKYTYDAVYRLIAAEGREHKAASAALQQPGPVDGNPYGLPHPNDPQALQRYLEQYEYDLVGNLKSIDHDVQDDNGLLDWERRYRYEGQTEQNPIPTSNRLTGSSVDGDDEGEFSATYEHDPNGNMTEMPHLSGGIAWDFKNQLRSADEGNGNVTYFTYDAAGQRVRKVFEHSGLIEERIYIGGRWEVYRRRNASDGELLQERETLHVTDDQRRIALVETLTVDDSDPIAEPVSRLRFQLDNHLGSAMLEVDDAGELISYEEYHPYGSTAYWAANGSIEVSRRRYRYTGKEKDEETGLYYHGARYYAPWLGRWTNPDPAGMVDGPNLYEYVRGNPIRLRDPNGREGDDVVDDIALRALQRMTAGKIAELGGVPASPEQEKAQRAEAATVRKAAASAVSQPEARQTPPAPGRDPSPRKVVGLPAVEATQPEYTPPSQIAALDPATQRLYKYLTHDNPAAGKVIEAVQFAGRVAQVGMALQQVGRAIGGQLGVGIQPEALERTTEGESLAGYRGAGEGADYNRGPASGPRIISPPEPGQVLLGGHDNPMGAMVLEGHGKTAPGSFIVPQGTYLQLPNATFVREDVAQSAAMRGTYLPGESYFIGPGGAAPNLVLLPPTPDMTVRPSSTTVTRPTLLEDILEPGMGVCVWGACK